MNTLIVSKNDISSEDDRRFDDLKSSRILIKWQDMKQSDDQEDLDLELSSSLLQLTVHHLSLLKKTVLI